MKKIILLFAFSLSIKISIQTTYAQSCGNRQLDSRVDSFLKMIGYQDLTLGQLRSLPIEQIKYPSLPLIPHPKDDVKRIKLTSDSIPTNFTNRL